MSIKQTFWKLLDVYDVEIPIIQRDYAQGRDSDKAAEIRKGFVRHLFDMINDTSRSEDLDFIYGSVRDDSLILLDGQQRLTTLFLLHWYLSTGASQVECANKKLSRFRYETRVSSREFLQSLLKNSTDLDLFTIEGKLSDKIKDAHWFFSVWNN
ncbi:DUF262 domain-containing protein, partial [Oleiphilus sp. HI0061]|uniref:DUF262 domain-containing protein n=1 Tax=Oleiphilus sp. HI0061 TaxID=1822239 RepID=UPI000AABBB40